MPGVHEETNENISEDSRTLRPRFELGKPRQRSRADGSTAISRAEAFFPELIFLYLHERQFRRVNLRFHFVFATTVLHREALWVLC